MSNAVKIVVVNLAPCDPCNLQCHVTIIYKYNSDVKLKGQYNKT